MLLLCCAQGEVVGLVVMADEVFPLSLVGQPRHVEAQGCALFGSKHIISPFCYLYLFLMCGCPGSRKSSFLSMFCKLNKINYEEHVVSRDLIRFSMVSKDEEYFSKEKEVFQLFINQIKYQINFNNYCFADATHLNNNSRMKLINSIGKSFLKDVNVIPLFVSVSEEVALYGNSLRKGTRAYVPEEAIIRMRHSFSDPAQDSYPYADIYNIYPISTITTDCGEITNIELKDRYEIHRRKKRR